MNLPDLHETYMSDSSRIHRGFMSFSFKPTRSNSCQIHGTFMVVSWQFHGTFTSKPDLGTVCQSPLKKKSPKNWFSFSIWIFLFSVSLFFFAICQFHLGFSRKRPRRVLLRKALPSKTAEVMAVLKDCHQRLPK